MIQDPHDPRPFRQWVKLAPDGTIATVHEFEAGVEQPAPALVETTHLFPFDTTALQVDPALVAALAEAHEQHTFAEAALADAKGVVQQAHVDLKTAVTNAGLQQKAKAQAAPPAPAVKDML